MLAALTVQRVALIESIQLPLEPGFNVFTGETGAGKSILLDAIGLLLGNRASVELIRTGADDLLVEGLFVAGDTVRKSILSTLAEWGIEQAGEEIVVSRQLHRSGRTVCRINGRMATVQMLRQLGSLLVQQHGQHEDLNLLRADEPLRLLDLYAQHERELEEVQQAFETWKHAKARLQETRLSEQERIHRLDILAWQIDEIDRLKLMPGEEEDLRALRTRLLHADKISGMVRAAVIALDGGDRGRGAIAELSNAMQQVAAAQGIDEGLASVGSLLENAQVHADEAHRALSKYLSGIPDDPDMLEQTDQRLAQIRGIERKYGATIEDVLSHLERSIRERDELERFEETCVEQENACRAAENIIEKLARDLHEKRVHAGNKLGDEVTEVLRSLGMPSAVFRVQVDWMDSASGERHFSSTGNDRVVFLLSANRGEDPKPMQKVASGGELSRMLLALKAVLARVDDVETLIFDEIDSGVSGLAAQKVAEQLAKLGRFRQVLCVTHSAQIAAAGEYHFLIDKQETPDTTTTAVQSLDLDGRIAEVARLVGAGVADTASEHAAAMLKNYRELSQSIL